MKNIKACLTSKTDDWKTPTNIYKAFMLLYLTYLVICYFKTKNNRKEFMKKITDHDKAIIKDYENCEWTPRKKKKNDNNN